MALKLTLTRFKHSEPWQEMYVRPFKLNYTGTSANRESNFLLYYTYIKNINFTRNAVHSRTRNIRESSALLTERPTLHAPDYQLGPPSFLTITVRRQSCLRSLTAVRTIRSSKCRSISVLAAQQEDRYASSQWRACTMSWKKGRDDTDWHSEHAIGTIYCHIKKCATCQQSLWLTD